MNIIMTSKNNLFRRRAISVHGNKYDYSCVNYVNNHTNIQIKCSIHGEFLQTPYKHLIGRGCQVCGGSKKLSTETFSINSKLIHGNKFDYSKVKYVNNCIKVVILCSIHGEFFQRPQDHMRGMGCPKCVGKNKTTEEFVKQSNIIHENKYDYSTVKYINAYTKIKIICKKHGEFEQTPSHHLSKQGCQKCIGMVSKQETEFLNYFNIPNKKENRQVLILRKKVDGYDEKTNTIYEFLGDYWHGNPKRHNFSDYNKTCKKTFGELYYETFNRFKKLNDVGYKIKYIWEMDWKRWLKNKNDSILLYEYVSI